MIAPLVLYAARAVSILLPADIPFDSLHTYLPLARQLLESPSRFFNNHESLKVAPGAIVYMALAGANPAEVKAANLAISLVALVLTFDAARKVGGRIAGAAAAWLFTLPPMLLEAGITLMAESPFVFLVALWIWATTYAADTLPSEYAARWQTTATVLAGIALACATLTRATYMYWLPFAVVIFLGISRWLQGAQRKSAVRIAMLHLLALALTGAFIARQTVAFGQPTIATGSGAALYFGSNPMLSGYEPPYFGLTYDVVSVTDGLTHLSIEGDLRLMATAKTVLQQTPILVLAQIYAQKLGALLFFSRAHLDRRLVNDRAWRVALVLLACLGAWGGRRHPVVWMVSGAAVYQCAVHMPVLYNPRYSIGALDILLALLAALGVAWLWSCPKRTSALACAGAGIIAGIVLGAYHQRASAPLMPNLNRINAPLLERAALDNLQARGWDGDPFSGKAQLVSGEASIEWQDLPLEFNEFAVLQVDVSHFEGKCRQLRISHTLPDGAARSTVVNLEGFRQGQNLSWGMTPLVMPQPAGRLHMAFQCVPGTRMQLGEIALYDGRLGPLYRPRQIHGNPQTP